MSPFKPTRRQVLIAGSTLGAAAGAAALVPSWLAQRSAVAQTAEPLNPLAIRKYAQQLTIPRVLAPTIIRDSRGRVVRHDYDMSANVIRTQMLPAPDFPATTVWAYGGRVRIPGSSATEFVASSPGPIFENVRGIPARVRWSDQIDRPHIFAVDPVLMWANPNAMEAPTPRSRRSRPATPRRSSRYRWSPTPTAWSSSRSSTARPRSGSPSSATAGRAS